MIRTAKCKCGESMISLEGRCTACNVYRSLPIELKQQLNHVERAISQFEKNVIEWLNENDKR